MGVLTKKILDKKGELAYAIMLDDGRVINTPDRPDLWHDGDDFFVLEAWNASHKLSLTWIKKDRITTVQQWGNVDVQE